MVCCTPPTVSGSHSRHSMYVCYMKKVKKPDNSVAQECPRNGICRNTLGHWKSVPDEQDPGLPTMLETFLLATLFIGSTTGSK